MASASSPKRTEQVRFLLALPCYNRHMETCHDCAVLPGELHEIGCDVERCMNCGRQAISCDCSDKEFLKAGRAPWSGEHPGLDQCRDFNIYAKLILGKGWIPCSKDDPDAREDLNTLSTYPWSKELRKHIRP